MIIAVEGCAHGELQKIYNSIDEHEKIHGVKVDLLLVCGDFQSTRNQHDLASMACPVKYKEMNTFYKYYTGELTAPVLTIFIGGNHEASNYLTELWLGGWVAPNIYYLVNNGVVNFGGLRIAGLSGIFKGHDYHKGWNEKFPLNEKHQRSIYHIRSFQIWQLMQLGGDIDIFLSHDWPSRIYEHGDLNRLLKIKKHFRKDVDQKCLGSPPAQELLEFLQPTYWFAAHLHVKYPAVYNHPGVGGAAVTRFLALDKCLPGRGFLQLFKIDAPNEDDKVLRYDPTWLSILRRTQPLVSHSPALPEMRDLEKPSEEEIEKSTEKFGDLAIQHDQFVQTADAITNLKLTKKGTSPGFVPNPQTERLCQRLGFRDMWAEKFAPPQESEELNASGDDDDDWGDDIFEAMEKKRAARDADLRNLFEETEADVREALDQTS